jgi:hypothetical protein
MLSKHQIDCLYVQVMWPHIVVERDAFDCALYLLT